MIKAIKIRLFPTKEQENLMWQHIGASRFIYNHMLEQRKSVYESGEKPLTAFDTIKLLTPLKKTEEFAWLNNVSNTTLQTVCRDLDKAYTTFFKSKKGFPKFKTRKKAKKAFPVCTKKFYFKDEKVVQVQKIGKVKYKTDYKVEYGTKAQKFSNVRISNVNGKWILTCGIECENQAPTLTDKTMGIDLGLTEIMVVCNGEDEIRFHNINKSKKMRTLDWKIRKTQRNISRKYEENKDGDKFVKTNNIIKLEDKLRKLHARKSNIRTNYYHQSTHMLVSLLPKKVVMEDLNIRGMMENRHLSKAIGNASWYELIRQMKYKSEFLGIEFVQADRFFASSKTCSACNTIHKKLKLKDRTFKCPHCGHTMDRDFQAALNLSRYVA